MSQISVTNFNHIAQIPITVFDSSKCSDIYTSIKAKVLNPNLKVKGLFIKEIVEKRLITE